MKGKRQNPHLGLLLDNNKKIVRFMVRKYFLVILLMMIYIHGKSQADSSLFSFGNLKGSEFQCNPQATSLIIVNRGTLIRCYDCKVNNLDFRIGIDSVTNQIIHYSTQDSNFLIKGFKYLTKEKNILDSLKIGKIIVEHGWAIYIPLSQEWNLAFKYSDLRIKNGKGFLKKGATPVSLFKRQKKYIGSGEFIIAL